MPASACAKIALIEREGFFADAVRRAGADVVCLNRSLSDESAETFRSVLGVVDEVKPDVLHFNGDAGKALLYCALVRDIPRVYVVRETDLRGCRDSIRSANAVVAVSQASWERIRTLGVPGGCLSLVPNGIDVAEFVLNRHDRAEGRRLLNIPYNAKVVLILGRIERAKRHDLVLRAVRQMLLNEPSLRLVVVGDRFAAPEVFEELLDLVDVLALRGTVTFIDFIPDVRPLFAAADVLVSCEEGGPTSRAVLEAMACGLPVVIGEMTGAKELLSHEDTGFIVSNRVASVVEGITEALARAHELGVGENARARVVSEYDSRVWAQRMREIYARVLCR
jgi:glycosyltransferase involved in cell wall biosynthesis